MVLTPCPARLLRQRLGIVVGLRLVNRPAIVGNGVTREASGLGHRTCIRVRRGDNRATNIAKARTHLSLGADREDVPPATVNTSSNFHLPRLAVVWLHSKCVCRHALPLSRGVAKSGGAAPSGCRGCGVHPARALPDTVPPGTGPTRSTVQCTIAVVAWHLEGQHAGSPTLQGERGQSPRAENPARGYRWGSEPTSSNRHSIIEWKGTGILHPQTPVRLDHRPLGDNRCSTASLAGCPVGGRYQMLSRSARGPTP